MTTRWRFRPFTVSLNPLKPKHTFTETTTILFFWGGGGGMKKEAKKGLAINSLLNHHHHHRHHHRPLGSAPFRLFYFPTLPSLWRWPSFWSAASDDPKRRNWSRGKRQNTEWRKRGFPPLDRPPPLSSLTSSITPAFRLNRVFIGLLAFLYLRFSSLAELHCR